MSVAWVSGAKAQASGHYAGTGAHTASPPELPHSARLLDDP